MKKIFLLLVLCFTLNSVFSQQRDISHWSIFIEGGVNQFDGDIRQVYNDIVPNSIGKLSVGAGLEYTLTPAWSVGLKYMYLPCKAAGDYYTVASNVHNASLFTSFNLIKLFFKESRSKWGLWTEVGGGVGMYAVNYTTKNNGKLVASGTNSGYYGADNNYNIKNGLAAVFPVDLLVEYNFTKNIALGAKVAVFAYNKDNLDGRNYWGVTNDYIETATLGLRWKFNAREVDHTRNISTEDFASSDLDGLKDKIASIQKEMNKLKPLVDKHEKFINDKTPDINKIPELEGRVKKIEDLMCMDGPDTDGDGVPDCRDKCPNTPAKVQVDVNGCPLDTDGDGVPDYLDKCPNVPGIAANKGCPEVKAETKKIFAQALQGIQFETAKDIIREQSFPILDKVVKVMQDNPEYNLVINGHTDSQGTDVYNQELSDKRSASVMRYLIGKGVGANRLTAKGYGESQPIADNQTAEGRYKNRRVEFKVEF